MDHARRANWRTRTVGVVAALALSASVLVGAVGLRGTPASAVVATNSPAYWLVASDGGIYPFGTASFGSAGGTFLHAPIVGSASTPSGRGYWLVASDGGVFSFGDARYHGSTGGMLLNRPIVAMAADPATGGYWLVAADGGVFSFNAPYYGSTGHRWLNQPIVGMTATPDGRGYWLVARDGGVFAFGHAGYHGSTGNMRLNQPVVGMAADAATGGYWLVASDGGIFSFGTRYYGSTGGIRLNQPIVGMSASPAGGGYWLAARDGGIFAFHAPFLGSTGGVSGPHPIVSIMSASHGYPFPTRQTGFDVSVYQCGQGLPSGPAFAVVQVAGAINGFRNPCYKAEAIWAGANMSAYIFMDGLPNPAPSESHTGPAGNCTVNINCEGYNFGWYWARHWVGYSRSVGVNTPLWWLDVETSGGAWNIGGAFAASNANVIAGAVAGLRSAGVIAGVYATAYQWGRITGSTINFPGIPLWVPGAGNVSSGYYSATNFCSHPILPSYEPFAGGIVTMVQYGYPGNGYTGGGPNIDKDYAC